MSFSSSESHDSSSAILVSNRNGAHPHNQPHDPIPGHYTQSRAGAPMFRDIIETLHELVAEEVPTENVLSVACLRLLIGETYFEHQAPPYLEEYKFRLATHNWDIVIQHRGEQTQEVIRIMKKFIKQSEELRHASGRPRIQRTISIAPSNPLVHQSLKGGFVSLQCTFCLRLSCITSIIFCMKNPDSFRDRLILTILRFKTPHGNIHREKIY